MTTNRLAKSDTPVFLTAQDHCDHGNAHLASIGRAHELHWVIRNGRANLEWSQPPKANVR